MAQRGAGVLTRALVQLRAPLRFRADFLASVVGNVMVMGVGATLLATLFAHVPSLAGWSRWEVVLLWSYLETAIALTHFACAGLMTFNRRYLVNGELDRALLRPGDPLLGVLVDNLAAEELPGVAVAGGVLALAAHRLGLGADALWLVPDLLGSLAVFGSILLVFASLGFHVRHSGTAVGMVFQAASYARYPFELYPRAVRALLTLGGLGFLAYVPVAARLHRPPSWPGGVPLGALHLPAAAAFMAAAYAFFRFGLRRYSSAGA